MKKTLFILLALSFMVGLGAKAQNNPTITAILTDATNYISVLEADDYEVVRVEMDLLNATKTSYRNLYNGWTYGIYVFGDYRIADVDIKIYKKIDGEWILIKKDETSDSDALVTITSSYTDEYRIEIVPYRYEQGYTTGHYGMIIYHE